MSARALFLRDDLAAAAGDMTRFAKEAGLL